MSESTFSSRILYVLSLVGLVLSFMLHLTTYVVLRVYSLSILLGLVALAIGGGLIHRRAYRSLLRNFYEHKKWKWTEGPANTREEKRRRLKAGFSLWNPRNLRNAMPHTPVLSRWLTYPFWLVTVGYLLIAYSLSLAGSEPRTFLLLNSLSLFVNAMYLTNTIIFTSSNRG